MGESVIIIPSTGRVYEIQTPVVSPQSYSNMHFGPFLLYRGDTNDNTVPVVHHDHRKIHRNLPHEEQITHQDLLYQLAREIRQLLAKVSDSKGRKYSYEEWTKFIHLINHDASKKDHISIASWSWLDNSSPLFRGKNETEWILERLSWRLEEELKRDTNGRDEGKGITESET
jgi:potassium channel subfamily K